MATEIIINDGGAPARIMPFSAGGTVAAGDCLQQTAYGVIANGTSGSAALGVVLTAATSGNLCNVVTGRGVQLKANSTGTIALGGDLMCDGAGKLKADAGAAGDQTVAIALEAGSGASTIKVLFF